MMDKMTRKQRADYAKAAVFAYLRFKRQCPYVATECGGFSSDLLALKDRKIIEVEIKVDLADFHADFEKSKHAKYAAGGYENQWSPFPNNFYFAVPEYLKDECLTKVKAEFPQYGVLLIHDPYSNAFGHWMLPVSCLKTAKDLQKNRVRTDQIYTHCQEIIARRTGSQLASKLEMDQFKVFEAIDKDQKYRDNILKRCPSYERSTDQH